MLDHAAAEYNHGLFERVLCASDVAKFLRCFIIAKRARPKLFNDTSLGIMVAKSYLYTRLRFEQVRFE